MSEPVAPLGAGIVLVGGSHLLGMPVDAVAIGALASLAVLVSQDKKSLALIIGYTVIGGLLGGAVAPILGHWFVEVFAPEHAFLHDNHPNVAHVAVPAFIGLLWQFGIKILAAIYPSLERRLEGLLDECIDFVLRRPKK